MNLLRPRLVHESNPPFVQLVRPHIRQLDAINLCNPRGPATVDIVEFFASALDLESLRENVAKATAIIPERFRLARPMAAQLSQEIAYCRNRFARHLRFEPLQGRVPSHADQRCINVFRFRSRLVGSFQIEQFAASAPLDSSPNLPRAAFGRSICYVGSIARVTVCKTK